MDMRWVVGGTVISWREAERLEPQWWRGAANRDHASAMVTVYPIPLNKIAQWSVRFYRWLQFECRPDLRDLAYEEGYQAGLNVGRVWRSEYLFDSAYLAGFRVAADALASREMRAMDDTAYREWLAERRATDKRTILGDPAEEGSSQDGVLRG